MRHVTDVTVFVMSLTFVLLAFQAEPITATLGYVCAGILFLALLNHLREGK